MKKCVTCGKRLHNKERKYCKSCIEFHEYNYSDDELRILRQEYVRLGK